MNIMTFDIEEWWHFDVYSTEDKWAHYKPRIELYLPLVLDKLEEKGVKASFFCLGWIARTYPDIIKRISARGHEIACHTDMHLFVKDMRPEFFREDLHRALDSIENVTGAKVKSFRAPAFTITENVKWAFEVLAEQGIEYDCSIFPTSRSYGGFPSFGEGKPTLINYKGNTIKEFPINSGKLLGKYFVFSGGGYFRLFPYWLIKHLLKQSDYAITYLHMRDFDFDQPRFNYFNMERTFKSYYGLKNAYSKFLKLMNDFQWVNIEQADKMIDWNNVRKIDL